MEKNLYWEHQLINNIAERYGSAAVFELDGPGKSWPIMPNIMPNIKPNHSFYSNLFSLYVVIMSVFSSSSSGKNIN